MKYDLEAVFSQFETEGRFKDAAPYGSGHINDTFLVTMIDGTNYILQRINHYVFKKPLELMDNVKRVTQHVALKVVEAGGNPMRESLILYKTKNGDFAYMDPDNNCWRVYQFVTGAEGYDQITSPEIAFQGGFAYGKFQAMLADIPGGPMNETILNFNNPTYLLSRFEEVLKADTKGRASLVEEQIQFVQSRAQEMQKMINMLKSGELPLRITHNDTKINNVLIDTETNKAVCVIDLDTVMSGCALNDFGDSIRTGAALAAEDEEDLTKVGVNFELFEAFTRGYLTSAKSFLTENEKNMMAFSAKLYPYIIGLRFITDYLEGDVYFKIHKEDHNLYRAKAQFALCKNMEDNFDKLTSIVNKTYDCV